MSDEGVQLGLGCPQVRGWRMFKIKMGGRWLSSGLGGMLLLGLILAGCSGSDSMSDMINIDNRVVTLELVASGLDQPLFVTHAGDERLMIVERVGRIRIVQDGVLLEAPFLDISALVSVTNERGLLSVAFHPDYAMPAAAGHGLFWVNYTDTMGRTVIARYRVMAADPDRAEPTSARILLVINQPFGNHNGGQLQFGPGEGPEQNRYLYIGMGDGGSGGDPSNAAQRDDTLLGKLLRIDPSTGSEPEPPFYQIPPDNPNPTAVAPLNTIWAKGLRNPYRFSFDAAMGDLYISDVGQGEFEEVHRTFVDTPGGVNYGWRIMEGEACFNPMSGCEKSGLDLPIIAYSHNASNRCAIIGGYVYRGSRSPVLFGTYLYADFCSLEIFGMDERAEGDRVNSVLMTHNSRPASFGEDRDGELYLTDLGGNVFRIAAE